MNKFRVKDLNGKNFDTWVDGILWKTGKDRQIIKTKVLTSLKPISVTGEAQISAINNMAFDKTMFEDILTTDDIPSTLAKPIKFKTPVKIKNLKTNSINTLAPGDFLISGAEQDVHSIVTAKSLKTLGANGAIEIGSSSKINKIDLNKDVAKIASANNFDAKVEFKTIAVKREIYTSEGVKIQGVDVDELEPIAQWYGTVKVRENIIIDNDVTVNSVKLDDSTRLGVKKDDLEDKFVFKNVQQDLPNLEKLPDISFDNLQILKTLNNLDLTEDLVHTSGDEIIDHSNIKFHGQTTFYKDILVCKTSECLEARQGSTINEIDTKDLWENNVYTWDTETTITGKKTFTSIQANCDVEIGGNFKHKTKDFGKFGTEVAQLGKQNEFTATMSFYNKNEYGLTAKEALSGGSITSDYIDTVQVNKKNLKTFAENVARKVFGTHNIDGPVEFKTLVATGRPKQGGKINNNDLLGYMQSRILKDDSTDIVSKLVANKFYFDEGLEVTAGNTFNDINLQEYFGKIFQRGASSISGSKTMHGKLRVGGNLGVNGLAFGVDLAKLSTEYLSIKKDQKIDVQYTFGSIKNVTEIEANIVDGVALGHVCLLDQECEIECSPGTDCVSFYSNIRVLGGLTSNINGWGMKDVLNSLSSNDNEYNMEELTVKQDFSWTENGPATQLVKGKASAEDVMISDLYNLVVKSNWDWKDNVQQACVANVEDFKGVTMSNSQTKIADFLAHVYQPQEITGKTVFTKSFHTGNIIIKSGKVSTDAKEINIQDIYGDCVWKDESITITSEKVFENDLKAKVALVNGKLSGLTHLNNILISDLKEKLFTKGSIGGSQEVSGSWIMQNGFNVGGRLEVSGEVDGVMVEDFVTRSAFPDRTIPKLTFNNGFSVDTLDASAVKYGVDLAVFLTNSVKLNSDEELNMELEFNQPISFEGAVNVDEINDIPFNEFVLNNYQEKQIITGMKQFNAGLTVKNNLNPLKMRYPDGSPFSYKDFSDNALMLNEDQEITAVLTFLDGVNLEANNVFFPTDLDLVAKDLKRVVVESIKDFADKLYDFYDTNIIKPLRLYLEEVAVAERLDIGKIDSLENQATPKQLNVLNASSANLDSSKLNQAEWGLSFDTQENTCGLAETCNCEVSSWTSSVSDQLETGPKSFVFVMDRGVFTITSSYKSYSPDCRKEGETGNLRVTSFIPDDDNDIAQVGKVFSKDVNTIEEVKEKLGFVHDVAMWDLPGKAGTIIAIAAIERVDFQTMITILKSNG